MKAELELYYVGNNNSYGTPIAADSTCNTGIFGQATIQLALAEATRNGATDALTMRNCIIGINGQSWAVSIPLVDGNSWCVGTTGSGGIGIATGGGVGEAAVCGPMGS